MALRNYLYAKHLNPAQIALINKMPQDCPPERAILLDDGTKKCANCKDCPKKDDGAPKIRVELDPNAIDFTNVART